MYHIKIQKFTICLYLYPEYFVAGCCQWAAAVTIKHYICEIVECVMNQASMVKSVTCLSATKRWTSLAHCLIS